MAKFLDKYAADFKKSATKERRATNATTQREALDAYENLEKENKSFSCRFELADSEGNLSLVDNTGVRIVLLAETFQKSTPYYDKSIKDRFIGSIALDVVVDKVDRENGVVFVASAVDTNQVKGTLLRQIFSELKDNKHPRLSGIVISVSEKRATINILNRNILGFLYVQNYQPIYTRSLTEFVNRGDWIEFDVIGSAPKKKGADYAFILDRKNVAPDPWASLPDFPKGSSIICKCVDRPHGKDFWWGTSASVPGIEVLCDYSEHVTVMKSAYYKCKVRDYDKEKHVLKVVPFEVIQAGIATEENISFIRNRRTANAKA